MPQTYDPAIAVEFGSRKRSFDEPGNPYRWHGLNAHQLRLIRKMILVLLDITRTPELNTRTPPTSSVMVERYRQLLAHRGDHHTETLLLEILQHFDGANYVPLDMDPKPADTVIYLLRQRLAEKNSLKEDNSILVSQELISLVDAQISQLREVMLRSSTWFSPEILAEMGVPLSENKPPYVNDDWHLPQPPPNYIGCFAPIRIDRLRRIQSDLADQREYMKSVEEALLGTLPEHVRRQMLCDLKTIVKRISRLEKSLAREERIRAYAMGMGR